MSAEPDKFFLGVVDLFSIILPGAVLTYAARMHPAAIAWLAPGYTSITFTEAEGWAVFLVASYVLGHFVFLIGALIDDGIYDRLRRATPWQQNRRIESGKKPAWRFTRWAARLLFGVHPDAAIARVLVLKQLRVPDKNAEIVVNAFQWAKARLALQYPGALAEVHRLEADSKFFRSFAVVLLLFAIVAGSRAALGTANWPQFACCAGFLLFSVWRYVERRFKATQQAYWYLLTLETIPVVKSPEQP